ncbi:NAD+ synthase [Methanofollis aquaemaris]|uniref:NH(3)-dependent NAD(+) synthetase n=1 Tax=Methanofollis aquaemaris TaxID=126734 RepID=A0A8A3S7K7_9EURY|nr:NAD+ synthase [Methanofollis aquaemaris]QSZ67664.1 NAD+ synthase [Methanofollis aquaemaris]
MIEQIGCVMEAVDQMVRHAVWNAGADGIVVGISGGVDSAVAAGFAARAVGPERVVGIALPSAVTPPADLEDAGAVCRHLGIELREMSIEPVIEAYRQYPGLTESKYVLGNLMARTRMTLLYAVANQENRLVCGTSNRTEYLVGYSTKHGDAAADIQPILHLYKTEVFEVAREMGLPARVVEKPPSAGLWTGQTDEKELGATYDEIDAALRSLAEKDWMAENEIEELVLKRVRASAHKRVAPPDLLSTR